MAGAVKITLNQAAIHNLLTSPAGPLYKTVSKYNRRTLNQARRRAPVDKGQLRASLQDVVYVRGHVVVGRVYSPLEYAYYQHEGTGIYGPKRRPIKAKPGKVFVFKPGRMIGPLPKGKRRTRGRGLVFTTEVKGTPKNPFLLDALKEVVPWPVREK